MRLYKVDRSTVYKSDFIDGVAIFNRIQLKTTSYI